MALLTAWSYSRYETWSRCPLQFKLKFLDKIAEPGSPAMERGDRIHKGIAAYITTESPVCPDEALVHPAISTLIYEARAISPPDRDVEQQWGYTSDFKATGWFGGDTWFRSILDLGVGYEDGSYEAVDWKTGKRYGSNDEQVETQALAVMSRMPQVTHVTTRLAYVDSGEQVFNEFPGTHRVKLAEKWQAKVKPMFADTVFAPRPNDKCKFCHYARSKSGKCAFG